MHLLSDQTKHAVSSPVNPAFLLRGGRGILLLTICIKSEELRIETHSTSVCPDRVERIWHFLAGLDPLFREPLFDDAGRPAHYQAVTGFKRGAAGKAGTVEAVAYGWKLNCRGGVVLLAKAG